MPFTNPQDYLYDEDILGTDIHNKIENELHLVTAGAEVTDFNFIVPKMQPYFKESMVVRHVTSNRILTPGVDWQPGHLFDSASFETEWVRGGIYGSILLMDRSLIGQFELVEYQTLGGAWVLENTKLLEILSNRMQDPRTTTYEQVSGKPNVFPPTGHNHPVHDFLGMSEAVSAMDRINESLQQRTEYMQGVFPGLMDNYYTKPETVQTIHDIVDDVVQETVDREVGQEMIALNQALNTHISNTTTALASRYTKTESDARYYQKNEVYTKQEVDGKFTTFVADHYTKSQSDSRYFLRSDTYNRSEQDNRYRQLIQGNAKVYVTSEGGHQSDLPYTREPTKNTIAYRDNDGRLRIVDGVHDSDAVTMKQYNTLSATAVAGLGDRYTKTESDAKYRVLQANASHVYATNANKQQTSVQYTSSNVASTMVQRDSGGRIAIGAPVNDDHATTKKYVDGLINSTTTRAGVVLTGANASDNITHALNGHGNSNTVGWADFGTGDAGIANLGYLPESTGASTVGEILQIAFHTKTTDGDNIRGRHADARDASGNPIWNDPFTFITSANISAFQSDYDPIGAITVGPWNSLPGSLKMVGQLVNRADYPKLWTFVNTYGYIGQDQFRALYPGAFTYGNGTTTFRLPDMRGLFVRGQGGNSGALAAQQIDAIRNITGKFTAGGKYSWKYTETVKNGEGAFRTVEGSAKPADKLISTYDNAFGLSNGYDVMFDASNSVTTSNENRPINVAWNYFIRAF